MYPEQPVTDLLAFDDLEYTRAESGKRFANYIIDLIVFYILIFGIGILIAIISPDTLDAVPDDEGGFSLLDRIFTMVFYALYMGIVETIFKGKSLGKLITKTRAVNLDGSPITGATAFTRGLSRAVPFCSFSALGTPCNPWHDRWTNTMVIDERSKPV